MKFAINVPNFGDYADAKLTAALARAAEDAGWDGFFVWDHINAAFEPGSPMADPWVLLTAIAVATERIRIGTMVTPVARRRPWKLARETVTIDRLSGGRLILGVGLGFPPDFPTWGRLLYDGKDFLQLTPDRVIWPGLAISLTVLSVNYMGDGLRDALDPRSRDAP